MGASWALLRRRRSVDCPDLPLKHLIMVELRQPQTMTTNPGISSLGRALQSSGIRSLWPLCPSSPPSSPQQRHLTRLTLHSLQQLTTQSLPAPVHSQHACLALLSHHLALLRILHQAIPPLRLKPTSQMELKSQRIRSPSRAHAHHKATVAASSSTRDGWSPSPLHQLWQTNLTPSTTLPRGRKLITQ